MKVDQAKLRSYLEDLYHAPVKLEEFRLLGRGFHAEAYLVAFGVGGEKRRLVLRRLRGEGFGHDYPSDRAQVLLYAHSVFNKLPRHIRSEDVGYFAKDGTLKSVGDYDEFFILIEEARGEEYIHDMENIKERGELSSTDRERVRLLSDYLVNIHSAKKNAPTLYTRRIRDLIGHGECVMGVIDSCFPRPSELEFTSPKELADIEKKCVEWRWRLRDKAHRLCQIHGDYHPFNIIFTEKGELLVMDRSRGEWGEPADDVACLSINFLWYAILHKGDFSGPFKELFEDFLSDYLEKTQDYEMLKVMAPFYAFRTLVIASPLYYPETPNEVRRKLFNFMLGALNAEEFDSREIDSYLRG